MSHEDLRQRLLNDPIHQEETKRFHQKMDALSVAQAFEQTHVRYPIVVTVTREEERITLFWRSEGASVSGNWYASFKNISLKREDGFDSCNSYQIDTRTTKVTYTLEQGQSYLVELSFILDMPSEAISDPQHGLRLCNFVVSIPLSRERKTILAQIASKDAENEKLKHALGAFIEREQVFEDMLSSAIEQIAAKDIAPENKEHQIARFKDYAKFLRSQMGK